MARRNHRKRIALALAGMLLAWGAVARAADEPGGRDWFKQGVKALRANDFAAAAAAFQQSYERWPRAAALCNLALTYDRWSGHEAEAVAAYERCADADASGRMSDHARVRAAELRGRPTVVTPEPVPPPPSVETAPVRPADEAATQAAQPETTRATPAAVAAPSHAEKPARRPLYKAWWLWTGVAVVAVAGAVVLGVELGLRDKSPPPSLGTVGPNATALTLRF